MTRQWTGATAFSFSGLWGIGFGGGEIKTSSSLPNSAEEPKPEAAAKPSAPTAGATAAERGAAAVLRATVRPVTPLERAAMEAIAATWVRLRLASWRRAREQCA
jgi:hypothetical protein